MALDKIGDLFSADLAPKDWVKNYNMLYDLSEEEFSDTDAEDYDPENHISALYRDYSDEQKRILMDFAKYVS